VSNYDNGSPLIAGKSSQETRQIRPEAGARLGRSIASWLVYEVIGLWTGDPKVVERALGRPGAEPTMLVELEVVMVPTNPDRRRITR
jgi:hypothetical protein